ncbi:MAG: hypothetical protein LQ345_001811, partial [Seirophora villosa]
DRRTPNQSIEQGSCGLDSQKSPVIAAISQWEDMGLSRSARSYVRITSPPIQVTDIELTNQWRRYENLCRNSDSLEFTDFYIHGTTRAYECDLIHCWVHFAGWKLSKEWRSAKREWKRAGKIGEPIPCCFPPGYKPRFAPDREVADVPDYKTLSDASAEHAHEATLPLVAKRVLNWESPGFFPPLESLERKPPQAGFDADLNS